MNGDLEIQDGIAIPGNELELSASRAGGPGGQHVNKTSSRVTLQWNRVDSKALDEGQRARILRRLQSRITADGFLKVNVDTQRSQHKNLEIARQRLCEIVRAALRVEKKRRATRVPRGQKEQRLEEKKKRGALKRLREAPDDRE